MSHHSNHEPDRFSDTPQANGPLGLGAVGWIVIGALIGVTILLVIGQTQAPGFALGGVGTGMGIILGSALGRKNSLRK